MFKADTLVKVDLVTDADGWRMSATVQEFTTKRYELRTNTCNNATWHSRANIVAEPPRKAMSTCEPNILLSFITEHMIFKHIPRFLYHNTQLFPKNALKNNPAFWRLQVKLREKFANPHGRRTHTIVIKAYNNYSWVITSRIYYTVYYRPSN